VSAFGLKPDLKLSPPGIGLIVAAVAVFFWPLWGVTLFLGVVVLGELLDLRRDVVLSRSATYPPMWSKYVFTLTISDPEALGLTVEERSALAKASPLPVNLVLEEWQGFRRWRIQTTAREITRDVHGSHGRHTVTLWEAWLSPDATGPTLALDWTTGWDRGIVRLYAKGGRFGGQWKKEDFGPDYFDPDPAYLFCQIPLPIDSGARRADDRRLFKPMYPDIATYRAEAGYYACDSPSGGYRWTLQRYDFRHYLLARVIRAKSFKEGTRGLLVKLEDTKHRKWVDARNVEPDRAGRAEPFKRAWVEVVLNEQLVVDRVLPHGAAYLPPRCPKCRRNAPADVLRRQDGVCSDCWRVEGE